MFGVGPLADRLTVSSGFEYLRVVAGDYDPVVGDGLDVATPLVGVWMLLFSV